MCTCLQRYRALSPFHLSKKMSSFQNDFAFDKPPNSTEDDEYLVLPAPNLPDIDDTQIIDKEDEEVSKYYVLIPRSVFAFSFQ